MTRLHRLTLIAALALPPLALIACGDGGAASKDIASKAEALASNGSSKGTASKAATSAEVASARVDDSVEKSVDIIQPGRPVSGELSENDPVTEDGSSFDLWTFEVGERSAYRITMTSDIIDSYLILLAGDPFELGQELDYDDDGAGALDAEMQGTLAPGSYTIVANSYGAGDLGSYQLSLDLQALGGVTSTGSGGPAVLQDGRTLSGTLEESDATLPDGSYYDAWHYTGQAGERVTVSLSSPDFDTYLIAAEGSSVTGGEILGEDDDGGDGLDSELTVVLPAAGTYVFAANALMAGATGSYQISLRSEGSSARTYETGGDPAGKYALLVGIDDYPGTGNDLRGPVEDARIMERVLTERFGFAPENVVTLNDDDATRENIANGILQHLGQAGPDGVAVFFYSGHGMQVGQNIGLTGALDPEPAGEGDEALYIYGYDEESTALLDEEIGYLIETIGAGRTLVAVDACFSGEITRAAGDAPQTKIVSLDDPEVQASFRLPRSFIGAETKAVADTDALALLNDLTAIEETFRRPARHIMWGSSTEDQVSWTSDLGNNASVFTYYLGEALMAAPLSASFRDLERQVHDNTMDYILRNDMTDQNPVLRGDNATLSLGAFFGVN